MKRLRSSCRRDQTSDSNNRKCEARSIANEKLKHPLSYFPHLIPKLCFQLNTGDTSMNQSKKNQDFIKIINKKETFSFIYYVPDHPLYETDTVYYGHWMLQPVEHWLLWRVSALVLYRLQGKRSTKGRCEERKGGKPTKMYPTPKFG